jgi:hypothetical protein
MHCALQFWEGGVLIVTLAGFMHFELLDVFLCWPEHGPDRNRGMVYNENTGKAFPEKQRKALP